jgi:hypothetical protein
VLTVWEAPRAADIKPRVNEFLQQLNGPVALHIPGRDVTRTRVLVTLAHGNEPSGLEAVHRWLLSEQVPAVNLVIVLASVQAALAEPLFFFRMLPGDRDLNRSYNPPYTDGQGALAQEILQHIRAQQPEAVIDMHNTSGSSPAFSVSIGDSPQQRALTGIFVQRMIVTDLRLGSLMEQDAGCPIVTIEAGGSQDELAGVVAYQGLENYFHTEDLYRETEGVVLFRHPLRLELSPHSRIDYSDRALHDRDITVRHDIENFNFAPVEVEQMLGWLDEDGLSHLRIGSDVEGAAVEQYFRVENGQLFPAEHMRLFMATTRPDIAASDCLFYFVIEPAGISYAEEA